MTIEQDPQVCFGRAHVRGVPVHAMSSRFLAGESVESIAKDYDLTREDVVLAVAYAIQHPDDEGATPEVYDAHLELLAIVQDLAATDPSGEARDAGYETCQVCLLKKVVEMPEGGLRRVHTDECAWVRAQKFPRGR